MYPSDVYGLFSINTGVRLVGSDSHSSGRVLMFLNGTWGTVCGDGWDDTDATNLCQQLDLGNTGFAVQGSQFNESFTTWKAVVNCISNETSLRDCPRVEQMEQPNCPGGEDAGVICSGKSEAFITFMFLCMISSCNFIFQATISSLQIVIIFCCQSQFMLQ